MSRPLLRNARKLRVQQTSQEYLLWGLLRNRRLNGNKFRRQFVIGPYIADFCCFEKKLVVELDSSGHAEIQMQKQDQIRDQYFQAHGFRVLRFWNNEFDQNKRVILELIRQNLEEGNR